jgi:DNA-binding transcriptional LysR family regulator
MNVSLRLLRVFLAVSREGNVGRAASALHVSQPSLSQDIRRLEREIGTPLFLRGPQGVSLTAAGEAFRRDVEDALALLDRAVERAQMAGRTKQRRIVLGFSPSIGHQLMPSLLPLLERRLPDIAVDEREVDTGAVAPGVRSGAFDVGLAHCQGAEAGLTSVTVRDEPLCVALAADHPLSRRQQPLRLAELDELALMVWPREIAPDYYDRLVAICQEGGLLPKVVHGPRRAIIRSYAVSGGDVFCLLPLSTSGLQVPGVSFVPVADPHATVALVLVRREREEREEVRAVWDVLLQVTPSL